MVATLRNSTLTLETPKTTTTSTTNNHHPIGENGETQVQTSETHMVSEYEQSREERIRENQERMRKLGIVDLSLKLNSMSSARRKSHSNRTTPKRLSPLPPPPPSSGPVRRSSRLGNATPVSYSELCPKRPKKHTSLDGEVDLIVEGSRPEVYTEEHEKLLGNTEMSWTLFIDGCDKDGKRIYDQVKGKTCHQCRQKTLGHRTHCSKCKLVQGQFCGDCLYMRYGEHVLEAKQTPNWICPACRGICNCSLCRQAKGWPPTGALYRKISKLGFKSVAHYLIQTRRAQTVPDTNPPSAKRSLPFSDTEAVSKKKESLESKDNHQDSKTDDGPKSKEEEIQFPKSECGDCETAIETSSEPTQKPILATKPEFEDENKDNAFKGDKEEQKGDKEEQKHFLDCKHGDHNVAQPALGTEPESEDHKTDIESKNNEEEKMFLVDYKHGSNSVAQRSITKSKRSAVCCEPIENTIAGRLRERRRSNGHDKGLMNGETLAVEQIVKNVSSEKETQPNTIAVVFVD